MPIGDDDDVWVYRNLHLDGDIVISNHEPELFETYVAHLCNRSASAAAPPSEPRTKRAKIAGGDVAALLAEFPWLNRDDLQPPAVAARAAGGAAFAARPGAEEAVAAPAEEPPEPFLDDAVDEDRVWEELAELREEFHNPEEAAMQF